MSNVGYNASFLDQKGQLTDIGSWYLGKSATGVIPKAAAGRVQLGWTIGLVVAGCALVML